MDRPMEHRPTVLVPLDGSSFGEAILGTVERLARPLRARVILLVVAGPAAVPERTPPAAVPTLRPAFIGGGATVVAPASAAVGATLLTVEDALGGYLRRIADDLSGIETRLVVDIADDPAAVIIARARQEHVDLIAMATHGRTGLMRHLAGSVCERVIRSGVAPVVVLRP